MEQVDRRQPAVPDSSQRIGIAATNGWDGGGDAEQAMMHEAMEVAGCGGLQAAPNCLEAPPAAAATREMGWVVLTFRTGLWQNEAWGVGKPGGCAAKPAQGLRACLQLALGQGWGGGC